MFQVSRGKRTPTKCITLHIFNDFASSQLPYQPFSLRGSGTPRLFLRRKVPKRMKFFGIWFGQFFKKNVRVNALSGLYQSPNNFRCFVPQILLCRGGVRPPPSQGSGQSGKGGGSRPLATLGEGKCPFFGFAWFVLTFPDCPCVPHVCSHLPCEQLHSAPIHCPAIMYQTGISSFVLCCLYNFFCSYFGNVLILVGNNRKKNQNLTESLVMWKNLWS